MSRLKLIAAAVTITLGCAASHAAGSITATARLDGFPLTVGTLGGFSVCALDVVSSGGSRYDSYDGFRPDGPSTISTPSTIPSASAYCSIDGAISISSSSAGGYAQTYSDTDLIFEPNPGQTVTVSGTTTFERVGTSGGASVSYCFGYDFDDSCVSISDNGQPGTEAVPFSLSFTNNTDSTDFQIPLVIEMGSDIQSSIPEPPSFALLAFGIVLFGINSRRRVRVIGR